MARMRFAIELTDEAVSDFKALKASSRAAVTDAMEVHLRREPEKVSRSRIKRLRETSKPQFRLRVDDVWIFYDVEGSTVTVHAIVLKSEAASWLARFGKSK
jgi:mRNA-degrading endonuclease RelE of RelBE toxin-antitoxin system